MARSTHKQARKVSAQTRQYVVLLTPEKGGWYSVTCPSLPGCHSQGKGLDKAMANIREAIELTLEDMAEHGETLPAGDALLATIQV